MKPKYEQGQAVRCKVDDRKLIVFSVLDEPNASDQTYLCRYGLPDGDYNIERFKECELIDNSDNGKNMINCSISWCKYEHDGKCSLDNIEILCEHEFPVCDNFVRIFTDKDKDEGLEDDYWRARI